MFLLPTLLVGMLVAVALGGDLRRILDVRFRLGWTAPLALAIQIVAFGGFVELSRPATATLHFASYGLLVTFAVANRRLTPLLPVITGMLLNLIAITANGGVMPISASAAQEAGLTVGSHSNVSTGATHVRYLGDIFALPSRIPLADAFSIGDLLIGFGVVAFIAFVALGPQPERPLSIRRLVAPLGVPSFGRLTTGRFVSQVGDWLTLAAVVGWMFERTHSTAGVAAALLVRIAPPIVGSGLAAIVVDRLPKRPLLVGVELARAVALLAALAFVAGGRTIEMLVALGASGFLAAVSAAAVPALVPRLLDGELYASGNAVLGIAENGATALGAAGGGLVLALFGIQAALALDLGTFALAALLFASLRLGSGATERAARAAGRLQGLRYLCGTPRLLTLVLSFAAATLATGLVNATLPRFLEVRAGLGPGAYGYGLAAILAGLATGQVIVGFMRLGAAAGRWIGCGLMLMAGLFGLLALDGHGATIFLLLVVIGIVDGTTDVVFETLVQREAPRQVLGSVFGFAAAFVRTTMILSVALAPLLNGVLPVRAVITVAAAFLAVTAAVALAMLTAYRPGRQRGVAAEGVPAA